MILDEALKPQMIDAVLAQDAWPNVEKIELYKALGLKPSDFSDYCGYCKTWEGWCAMHAGPAYNGVVLTASDVKLLQETFAEAVRIEAGTSRYLYLHNKYRSILAKVGITDLK